MVKQIANMDEFKSGVLELSKSKLVVVDFTATWCGPCRYIGPVFEQFATEYTDAEFVKVDVDEADDVAANCGIRAMPTFHFYKNGEKVSELMGADSEQLKMKIEQNL